MNFPQFYQQQQSQPNANLFISVQSEDEARAWAVAPGNSIMFKNENEPYYYTKTAGFSPLDQPRFEKFRLIKEEVDPAPQEDSAIKSLKEEISSLKSRLKKLERMEKRQEDEDDE